MKKIHTLAVLLVLFMASCTSSLPTLGMRTNINPSPSPPPTETATQGIATSTCTVVASNLNLRREAGTNAAVDVVLNNGDVVTIDQDTPPQGNWKRVFYGDLAGWINTNFCK